jgi:hypothetical protein
MQLIRIVPLTTAILMVQAALWAAVTGRVAGTVTDPSGGAIPGAAVTVTNTAQGIQTKTVTGPKGDYSLPSLPVGTYDVLFEANGFRSEKRTSLVIDANAAIEQNMTLQLAQRSEEVTVTESAPEVHVETASTQLGDVVSGKAMTGVALNGRSFTDLLALQP